uniref:Chromo domain-containing protein n=1 Tax=Rhabditophanes sp. KR3021 TaxID=114890 RepID=A0AC35U7U7_9BILA
MSSEKSASQSDTIRFEVDRISGRRLKKGVYEYKIFWKNYPDDQFTWEAKQNISKEIVAAYDKQFDTQKKSSCSRRETIVVRASDVSKKLDAKESLNKPSEEGKSKRVSINTRSKQSGKPIKPSLRNNKKAKDVKTTVIETISDESAPESPQESNRTLDAISKSSEPRSNTRERSPLSLGGRRNYNLRHRSRSSTRPVLIRKSTRLCRNPDPPKIVDQRKKTAVNYLFKGKVPSKGAVESESSKQKNSKIDDATSSDDDGSICRKNPCRSAKNLSKKHKRVVVELNSEDEKSKKSTKAGSGSDKDLCSPLRKKVKKVCVEKDIPRKGAFFCGKDSESSDQSYDSQPELDEDRSISTGFNESVIEKLDDSVILNAVEHYGLDEQKDSSASSKKNTTDYLSPPKKTHTTNNETISVNDVDLTQLAINIISDDDKTVQNIAPSDVIENLGMGNVLPFDETKTYIEANIEGIFGTELINTTRVYSALLANKCCVYLTIEQIPKECNYMVMELLNYMNLQTM